MRLILIAIAAAAPLAGCSWMNDHVSDNGPSARTTTTSTETTTTTTAAPAGQTGATGMQMASLSEDQRKASVDKLNEATRMLIDSSKLYADASKLAKNASVKAELANLSSERGDQATQFQNQVRALGGDAVTEGGMGGAWQEGLMKTKSLVQKNTKAAVDQVLASENGIIDKFNDDLADASLPDTTKSFIKTQRDANQADRDRITELKSKVDKAIQG